MLILGGLVSAVFWLALQEQRMGRSSVALRQALDAADTGLERILDDWRVAAYAQIRPGTRLPVGRAVLPGYAGWYRGSVDRLNRRLYLIRAEGFSRDSTARREVGLLVRIEPIDLGVSAALTTRDSIDLGGLGVRGADSEPRGWTGCPPRRPAGPAVKVSSRDSSRFRIPGCAGLACLEGDPKVLVDSSQNTPITVGDGRWLELSGMATKAVGAGVHAGIGPVSSGGTCHEAVALNWGDPAGTGPCAAYFPLVRATGDLVLRGGRGQGILLVDGNLTVEGGFWFVGAVLVRGSFETRGTGGHFDGAVVAGAADLGGKPLAARPAIRYSSCALRRAELSAPRGAIRLHRGWLHVY